MCLFKCPLISLILYYLQLEFPKNLIFYTILSMLQVHVQVHTFIFPMGTLFLKNFFLSNIKDTYEWPSMEKSYLPHSAVVTALTSRG